MNWIAGEFRHVLIDEINFDPMVQRAIDQKRVAKMAKAFSEDAVKAVSINMRADGKLYCYDGQHTTQAAKAAGYTHVPAVIRRMSIEREAAAFLLVQRGRKCVAMRDQQRIGVKANDALSLRVQEILEEFGITVSSGGMRENSTNSVGHLRIYVKQNEVRTRLMLAAIKELWGDEKEAFSSIAIRGMFTAAGYGEEFLLSLMRGLRRHNVSARRVLDYARALQSGTGSLGGGTAMSFRALCELSKVSPQF